jgi:hypothetical protein
VDWLYDPANRDEAVEILARETKLDPAIAMQTYNYYVGDLQAVQPQARHPGRDHPEHDERR